jgi:hypothetical protein
METEIFNPQKGRLETIDIEFTDENTTWFDAYHHEDIFMITDYQGCLLIREFGYSYPILIYDVSREMIDYDKRRARELILDCEFFPY